MIINFIMGFLVPVLVVAFHLYKREPGIVILVGSFTAVLAFLINEFGYYFSFWKVLPYELGSFAVLPFILGLYPSLASYMVYLIKKYGNPLSHTLLMTVFTTILETIYVWTGMAEYGNGWNLFWTFISYLVPFTVVYIYFRLLKKALVHGFSWIKR